MQQKKFKGNLSAITAVISAVLVVVIVIGTTTTILVWGLPYINRMQAEASQENVYSQFNIIKDSIQNMAYEESGAERQYNVDVSEGNLNFDEDGDRLIIQYSTEPNHNFSVSGLNDDDMSFQIQNLAGLTNSFDHIDIFWFEDPEARFYPCEDFYLLDNEDKTCIFLKFNIKSFYDSKNIAESDIASVKVRLFPIDKISSKYNFNPEISLLSNDNWDENQKLIDILNTGSFDKNNDSTFFLGSDYVEWEIKKDFIEEYTDKDNFISVKIEDSKNNLVNPTKLINDDILKLKCNNIYSFYSSETQTVFKPVLIINYVNDEINDNNKLINSQCGFEQFENNKIEDIKDDVKSKGSFYSISNNIKPIATENIVDNIKYNYFLDTGIYKAFFQDISSESLKKPIVIEKGHYRLDSTPGNLFYVSGANFKNLGVLGDVEDSNIFLSESFICYPALYGLGFDLSYSYDENLLKEFLTVDNKELLNEPVDKNSFLILEHTIDAIDFENDKPMGISFGSDNNKLRDYGTFETSFFTTGETIFFTDEFGETVFSLPKEIYSWDSSKMVDSKIKLTRSIRLGENGKITVWIRTPCSWLFDDKRVFPIVIDDSTHTTNDNMVAEDHYNNVIAKSCLEGENPPLPPNSAGYSAHSAAARKNLEDLDENYNSYLNDSIDDFVNLWYSTVLFEPINTIKKIDIQWHGLNGGWDWNLTGADILLYVWDYVLEQWVQRDGCQASSEIKVLSFTIDDNYNRYIPSGKPLEVAVSTKGKSLASGVAEYYFEVFVSNDTVKPNVYILESPDGVINQTTVGFSWWATDNVVDTEDLYYSYNLNGSYPSVWSAWGSERQKTFYNLPDGDYTFEVKAKDFAGNVADVKTQNFKIVEGWTHRWLDLKSGDNLNFDVSVSAGSDYGLPIKGHVQIDIYTVVGFCGRILIFDLGLLEYEYPSSVGSFKNILENGGILLTNPDNEYMRKEPIISFNDETFAMRVMQIKQAQNSYSAGSGISMLTSSLENNYIKDLLREVHDFKIQIWGPNEDIWLDYFINTHGFSRYQDNYLLLKNNNPAWQLILSHSICNIGFK